MKKFFAIFIPVLVIVCVISIVGISKSNDEPKAQDASVSQNDSIDVTAAVTAKAKATTKKDMGSVSLLSPFKTDEEKFSVDGVTVLQGEVIKTNYVLDGSTVYTKSEVKVIKCYQGKLSENDTIYVKELGGFVPSDVYSNAISQEKFGTDAANNEKSEILDMRVNDFKVMEAGEKVILFLVPVNNSSLDEFKNDCYDLIRMWQGKLLYNEKSDAYVPYVPEEELAAVAAKSSNNFLTVKSNNDNSSTNVVKAKIYSLEEFEKLASSVAK